MAHYRSFLFAPADHDRRSEKAFTVGADVVVLDLEDAVAAGRKVEARGLAVARLAQPRRCLGFVRINALDSAHWFDDLSGLIGQTAVDGIVVPKVEAAADLLTVERVMEALERRAGLPPGGIDLMPLIETARGLAAARSICAAGTRARRASFGAADFTADLGLGWTAETEEELAMVRAELVLASRLAGLEAPVDSVFIHLDRPDLFATAAQRGRRLGFQGKLLLHPDQVAPTHAAFAPDASQIATARRIVAAFAEAQAAELASIRVDGVFVDGPVARKAAELLALAEANPPP